MTNNEFSNMPAGMDDENCEFFRHDESTVLAIYSGAIFPFNELPYEVTEPLSVELIRDKKAMDCLKTKMGIKTANLLEQFTWCRYGGYNNVADLCGLTKILTPDAPSCPKEHQCPGFGIICLIPSGCNGQLTKQEYFVVRLVAKGKRDKEISDELNIAISTVRTYMQRIHYKLNVNDRIEISLWAHEHGIK
jgi:DNA-binding CsgD family transcriptional regulator